VIALGILDMSAICSRRAIAIFSPTIYIGCGISGRGMAGVKLIAVTFLLLTFFNGYPDKSS
jgi:hypothetical protein